MLDQLDLVKDNFLSNAAKIKEGFKDSANFVRFSFNSESSVGSTNESKWWIHPTMFFLVHPLPFTVYPIKRIKFLVFYDQLIS